MVLKTPGGGIGRQVAGIGADDRLLDTKAAGEFLNVNYWTLIYWRTRARKSGLVLGPDFIKMGIRGPVRYSLRDLQRYVRQRTVRASSDRKQGSARPGSTTSVEGRRKKPSLP
jgi:hypothetical protein